MSRSASASGKLTSNADPQIEILYNVPGARIISFSPKSSATLRPSSSSGYTKQDVEVGSLQWSSPVERTIAVGTLRIYRAPESVAFLNCQQALKPILPRSQCWFVSDDGSSKFVLQVRKLQEYWRIEIMNRTSEEVKQVEDFKEILAQVLLFEKTPCPFQRTFSVDLPDAPQTPIKKKPWRPVQRSSSGIPLPRGDLYPIASKMTAVTASSTGSPNLSCIEAHSSSPLQLPELLQDAGFQPSMLSLAGTNIPDTQNKYSNSSSDNPQNKHSDSSSDRSLSPNSQSPVISTKEVVFEDIYGNDSSSRLSSSPIHDVAKLDIDECDENSDATDDTNTTPKNFMPLLSYPPLDSKTRPLPLQNYNNRSVTAPPVLSLVMSPPSRHRKSSPLKSAFEDPESGFSSSVESFHSIQSWHSPLDPPSPSFTSPPSPTTFPYPHDNIVLPKHAHPTQEISQLNITPEAHGGWQTPSIAGTEATTRSLSTPPRTPTLINDGEKSEDESFEIITPSPPRLRHRTTTSSNSRRRTLSPLPAAVNLFSPPGRSRRLQTARHLPTAIIQKTCEILLSPPSHLLHMMINIASKIAAGEWRGVLLGEGEAVHWDFTEDGYQAEVWAEDDYGFSLAPTRPERRAVSQNSMIRNTGESWEVD